MKVIPIKEFTPPVGMEYNYSVYPGPGAYLITNGTLIILSRTYPGIPLSGWNVAPDGAKELIEEVDGGVDMNRFMDQLIQLTGKAA